MSDNKNKENPTKTDHSKPAHADKTVAKGQAPGQGGQSAKQADQPARKTEKSANK